MLMQTVPDEIDDPTPGFTNAYTAKLGLGMIFAIVGTVCTLSERSRLRASILPAHTCDNSINYISRAISQGLIFVTIFVSAWNVKLLSSDGVNSGKVAAEY